MRMPSALLTAVAVILTSCSAAAPSSTPNPKPTATASPTPDPTPTATPRPTPFTDPEISYSVWLDTFPSQFESLKTGLADAIESQFYWISSVDRLSYDPTNNEILVEATVDYESVYLNDPSEWRSDTWDLVQSWSRDVWGSYVTGFERGNEQYGYVIDWERFTPTFSLSGNAGRLTVSCLGSLIYRVSQRDATQTEFLAECSFKP